MTLFSDTDVWMLTDEQLTARVVEAFRAKAQVEAECATLLSAVQGRDLVKAAGSSSDTAWLSNLTGVSRGEASRTARQGENLNADVEPTRRVWATGDLTSEKASTICKAINCLPDWVGVEGRALAQTTLLELASRFGCDDLKRLANHIIEVIDPVGAEEHAGKKAADDERNSWAKTQLTMFGAGDGMTRGRFTLPNVQASMLKAVLEGLASPRRNDPRIYDRDGEHSEAANGTLTHDMKLGRAFCELIEHLPTDAMPQHGGLAATITISMTLDQLKNGLGTALLSTGDTMSASQARRFACNANLIPIVLDGKSKILDLGMAKRLYDRYQRIAMADRDKGCCWKGCDRPASWCEAHHLTHWCKGGPTDLAGGALFCFYHHSPKHSVQGGAPSVSTKANGTPAWAPTASSKSSHPNASTPNKNPSDTTDSPQGPETRAPREDSAKTRQGRPILQDYTDIDNLRRMVMRRLPITTASRLGVSKIASQSAEAPIALTRHGNVVAIVGSAERLDNDARLMRESAAAVIDAAGNLVASRGKRLDLDETCERLGISVDRVRARAAELQTR